MVTIAVVPQHRTRLPDEPYRMWLRGEIEDYLHFPDDGSRVEIISGEIAVSPAPGFAHNGELWYISDAFSRAGHRDPAFRWRAVQGTGLDLAEIKDGYIPDLLVIDLETFEEAMRAHAAHLVPAQVAMVVEVTSKSNAANDREPSRGTQRRSKWSGYASAGIPYYLLVDRDPKVAQVILYTGPDRGTGGYAGRRSWRFGETVVLSAPFGVEIVTDQWQPWTG